MSSWTPAHEAIQRARTRSTGRRSPQRTPELPPRHPNSPSFTGRSGSRRGPSPFSLSGGDGDAQTAPSQPSQAQSNASSFAAGSFASGGRTPFKMADMDLLEVNWLAALLLPQMNQRKKVICNTLADLTESASKAEALLAEADAVTQTPVASNGSFTRGRLINSPRDQSPLLNVDVLTEDAGGALDVGVARQLKPYAQAIVEKLKFAHNALISSLEGFAVAERNLKFAQSLGEMDLEEASALLQEQNAVRSGGSQSPSGPKSRSRATSRDRRRRKSIGSSSDTSPSPTARSGSSTPKGSSNPMPTRGRKTRERLNREIIRVLHDKTIKPVIVPRIKNFLERMNSPESIAARHGKDVKSLQEAVKAFVILLHSKYSSLAEVQIYNYRSNPSLPRPRVVTAVEFENLVLHKLSRPFLKYLSNTMAAECQEFQDAASYVAGMTEQKRWRELRVSSNIMSLPIISDTVTDAVSVLTGLLALTTPQDMLVQLAHCCELLTAALVKGVPDRTSAPGTDELLPLFAHTVVLSKPLHTSAPSLTAFMEMHSSNEMMGRLGYVHAVWCSAIGKIVAMGSVATRHN